MKRHPAIKKRFSEIKLRKAEPRLDPFQHFNPTNSRIPKLKPLCHIHRNTPSNISLSNQHSPQKKGDRLKLRKYSYPLPKVANPPPISFDMGATFFSPSKFDRTAKFDGIEAYESKYNLFCHYSDKRLRLSKPYERRRITKYNFEENHVLEDISFGPPKKEL